MKVYVLLFPNVLLDFCGSDDGDDDDGGVVIDMLL